MNDSARRLVVIVDDDENCADTLHIALEKVPGLEVSVASTADGALRLLEGAGARVAAVITDVQLPEMNGLELLARLREDVRFQSTPVMIISGDTDPRVPERAMLIGANAFFTKPYSPAEVRRRLEQLLT